MSQFRFIEDDRTNHLNGAEQRNEVCFAATSVDEVIAGFNRFLAACGYETKVGVPVITAANTATNYNGSTWSVQPLYEGGKIPPGGC